MHTLRTQAARTVHCDSILDRTGHQHSQEDQPCMHMYQQKECLLLFTISTICMLSHSRASGVMHHMQLQYQHTVLWYTHSCLHTCLYMLLLQLDVPAHCINESSQLKCKYVDLERQCRCDMNKELQRARCLSICHRLQHNIVS